MKPFVFLLALAMFWGCGSTTVITHSETDSTGTHYTHQIVQLPGKSDTLYITVRDTVIKGIPTTIYVNRTDTLFQTRNKVVYKKDRDSLDLLVAEVTHWKTLNDSRIEREKVPFTQKLGWGAIGAILMVVLLVFVVIYLKLPKPTIKLDG